MNIPVGTIRIQGKTLASVGITKDLAEFMSQDRMGYICLTIKGRHGIEEGLLIAENGLLIGSYYEYLSLGKRYDAKDALKRTLNSFFAEKGVYDSYELTVQQIELLKIFNEDMLFLEPIDNTALQGIIPMQFSEKYENEVLAAEDKSTAPAIRGLREIEIDNYQRIQDEMTDQIAVPQAAHQVEEGINSYLMGRPPREEPKEKPIVQEEGLSKKMVIKSPPSIPHSDLEDLDTKADELLKSLEKAREK